MNIYNEYDKMGQNKVINALDNIFSAHTHTYTQHIEDCDIVDIEMSLTSSTTNNVFKYVMEAKDREYSSTAYDSWYLEEKKKNSLFQRSERPYYVNTFTDGKIVFWDLSKLDFYSIETKYIYLPKTTVEKSDKIKKKVYMLPLSSAVYIGNI